MNLKSYFAIESGNATRLASAIGVSLSYLSQFASGACSISPARCVEIEEATKGAVSRKDLRPDDWSRIWPELRAKDVSAKEPTAA